MKYLVGTQKLCLTLKAYNTSCLNWYVDTAFAVHSYFKSHTGAIFKMKKRSNCICAKKGKTAYKK